MQANGGSNGAAPFYQLHSRHRKRGICFVLPLTIAGLVTSSFSEASESLRSRPSAYEYARGSGSSLTSTSSGAGPLSLHVHAPPDTSTGQAAIEPAAPFAGDVGPSPERTDSCDATRLAAASLPSLTTRRRPILSRDFTLTSLAFLAGVSDYLCFHRLQCFAIMQTGNVIHALSSMVEGSWKEASNFGCIVAAYAIGSGLWRIISLVRLLSSAVLVAVLAALPMFYHCDAILLHVRSAPLISLAFGLISSAATAVCGGTISFAYTGHISNAGKYSAERLLMRGRSFHRTPATSLRMLLGFAFGVLSSSLCHQFLLRSKEGEANGTALYLSRHPFFVLGIAYATVLIFGGVDLLLVSVSSGQKDTIAEENTDTFEPIKMGLEELISTKLKTRGIGRRRRRGEELDIRVDGWTNIRAGPRRFDDGS